MKWVGNLEQISSIHNNDMTDSASDGRDSAWGDKQTKGVWLQVNPTATKDMQSGATTELTRRQRTHLPLHIYD